MIVPLTSSAPGSAEAASRDAATPEMELGAETFPTTRTSGVARGDAAHQAGLPKPVVGRRVPPSARRELHRGKARTPAPITPSAATAPDPTEGPKE